MSTEKWQVTICLTLGLTGLIRSPSVAGERDAEDPVLGFYRSEARTVCSDRSPFEQKKSFSFTATTYLKELDRKGDVTEIDSVSAELYFSNGALDSQVTAESFPGKFAPPDFSYPNVFGVDYRFNFFPNDTGGMDLAIGFDSDSTDDSHPVGLAVIDRDDYTLQRLYLFYPRPEGFRRFTRIYHFVEHAGYVFPASISESMSKAGIFSSEYYRRETVISNVKMYP
jgi:hypothetical protein